MSTVALLPTKTPPSRLNEHPQRLSIIKHNVVPVFVTLVLFYLLLSNYLSYKEKTKKIQMLQRQERISELQCAPDGHSCGSLLAPTTTQLSCCNPKSYCYRRHPYFSQCRPRAELHALSPPYEAVSHQLRCIPSLLVPCNGQSLPCCSALDACVPLSKSTSFCVPKSNSLP